MEKKKGWKHILIKIIETKGSIKPLEISGELYNYIIIGDAIKKIGYMTIWNVNTLEATHISRMMIEGFDFFTFEEAQSKLNQIVPKNLIFKDLGI